MTREAPAVMTDPITNPRIPAPTTTTVECRRLVAGTTGLGAGVWSAGCRGPLLSISSVVMAPTVGGQLEVDLKKWAYTGISAPAR
jgi:hypothetical protein